MLRLVPIRAGVLTAGLRYRRRDRHISGGTGTTTISSVRTMQPA